MGFCALLLAGGANCQAPLVSFAVGAEQGSPGFDVGEMLQVIEAAAKGFACPSPTLGFIPVTGL